MISGGLLWAIYYSLEEPRRRRIAKYGKYPFILDTIASRLAFTF